MSDSDPMQVPVPREGGTTRLPVSGGNSLERRKRRDDAPAQSYYDVPMLKASVWRWEIASYFFFGGLSAGAYVLARTAARAGGKRYQDVTEMGTAIALAALLPCPALLIHDLGDPGRFHHMLRVFKPKSPMNFGAWVLSAYGGVVTLAALDAWRNRHAPHETPSRRAQRIDGALSVVADGAGIPLALLLAGYTGVLLSTSATPMWARNDWLGPLFSISAMSTGASAVRLALNAGPDPESSEANEPLEKFETVARVAEAVALGGYLASAGDLADPITKGKYAPHLWAGAVGAGLVIPIALKGIPTHTNRTRRLLRIAGAVAGLVGGLALRWAITHGGIVSGKDPAAARKSSR